MDGIIKLSRIPTVSTLVEMLTPYLPQLLQHSSPGTQGGQLQPQQLRIINCADQIDALTAHIGIFFDEVSAGCNCNDDPNTTHDYCEVHIHIAKPSAQITFAHVAT